MLTTNAGTMNYLHFGIWKYLLHGSAGVITGVLCCLLALCTAVATTPTPVLRYPCGQDRCVVNQQYCSHEDSPDEQDWLCVPCSEERHRCEKQLTKMPPACFGYCEVQRYEALLEATVANLTRENVAKEHYLNRTMQEAVDEALEKLENKSEEYAHLKRISVIPIGGLDNFLATSRRHIGVLALFSSGSLVVCLVYKGLYLRKIRRRIRVQEHGEVDLMEEGLIKPQQAMQKVAGMDEETQTEVSELGHHQDTSAFSQPSDPRAEGILVLPKGTDHVGEDGGAGVDDTTFLDTEPPAKS